MYKVPKLTKVPGDISYGNKKEKQGYIQDITKLTKCELLDLKNRQELLLRNKIRIAQLPDKGRKIEQFYQEILAQLKVHENVDRAAEMFSELNIASVGKKSLAKMEWNKKYDAQQHNEAVDSDDEVDEQNIDPLKILAQSRNSEKIVTISKPVETLITRQDLEEIDKFKREQATEQNKAAPKAEKFLPFRTTKSNVHDPEKEKRRCEEHSSKWENTSATPPALAHSPAKALSLEESLQLQEQKNRLLQQAQEQYAKERLLQRDEIKQKVMSTVYCDVPPPTNNVTAYRDITTNSDEEEEGHESEDDDIEYDSEPLDS